MKILCVSDTVMPQMESAVNLRRRYNDVQLLISCGDLPPAYLEFIVSVLNIPLFYVRGNHDERYENEPPGGEDLHQRVITHQGLTFAGLEGSMQYNGGPIQYSDFQMRMMVYQMGAGMYLRQRQRGHAVDFFVTHSPAFGIHDKKDLPHTGFKAFLQYMRWYKPRYMLHGHVHTWDRRETVKTQYHETCVMNINPVTLLEVDPL